MNKMMEMMKSALRGRGAETPAPKPRCCIRGCGAAPALVLAAHEGAIWRACAAHARLWVESPECRRGLPRGGAATPLLVRWVARHAGTTAERPAARIRVPAYLM